MAGVNQPPLTGDDEVDRFNKEVADEINNMVDSPSGTSDVETGTDEEDYPTVGGFRIGYQRRYLHVKYATNSSGTTGFTNDYTAISGLTVYQGLRNSDSATESTNAADYTWRELSVVVGWAPSYRIAGGRLVDWDFSTSVPTNYVLDNITGAIDLDNFASGATGASGTGFEEVFVVTAASITNIPSGQLPSSSWNYNQPQTIGGLTWTVSSPSVSSSTPLLWRSRRVISGAPAVGDAISTTWSTPSLIGRFGSDGASVTGPGGSANRLDIAYFATANGSDPVYPTGTLAGDNYAKAVRGTRNFQGTNIVTWVGGASEPAVSTTASDYEITQLTGDTGGAGASNQVYFAYANSIDGLVDFSTSYFTDALYVGTDVVSYVSPATPVQSSIAGSYEWARLKGEVGDDAYTIAVVNGFEGTRAEWLASLVGTGATVTAITGGARITDGAGNSVDIEDGNNGAAGQSTRVDYAYAVLADGTGFSTTASQLPFRGTHSPVWTTGSTPPAQSTTPADYSFARWTGSVWKSGSGVPASTLGNISDWYVDVDTEITYEKTSTTTWLQRAILAGDKTNTVYLVSTATTPETPVDSTGSIPSGWLDNPPATVPSGMFVWASFGVQAGGQGIYTWGDPVRTTGDSGETGMSTRIDLAYATGVPGTPESQRLPYSGTRSNVVTPSSLSTEKLTIGFANNFNSGFTGVAQATNVAYAAGTYYIGARPSGTSGGTIVGNSPTGTHAGTITVSSNAADIRSFTYDAGSGSGAVASTSDYAWSTNGFGFGSTDFASALIGSSVTSFIPDTDNSATNVEVEGTTYSSARVSITTNSNGFRARLTIEDPGADNAITAFEFDDASGVRWRFERGASQSSGSYAMSHGTAATFTSTLTAEGSDYQSITPVLTSSNGGETKVVGGALTVSAASNSTWSFETRAVDYAGGSRTLGTYYIGARPTGTSGGTVVGTTPDGTHGGTVVVSNGGTVSYTHPYEALSLGGV